MEQYSGETARIAWMGEGVVYGEGYRIWNYVQGETGTTLFHQNSTS
jgi:hypothetical protein